MRTRTWFWYPFYRMVYTKADHIQVISSWLKKRARRYGYNRDISLVPNGVDLKKFQIPNPKSQIDNLKKDLNIPPQDKIIFTSSRLVKKNDYGTLLCAFKILISDFSVSASLLIAGGGKLEANLKDLSDELHLTDKVIFLGSVKHDEVIKYYKLADLFVRPSLSEGQGIPLWKPWHQAYRLLLRRLAVSPIFCSTEHQDSFVSANIQMI